MTPHTRFSTGVTVEPRSPDGGAPPYDYDTSNRDTSCSNANSS
jgi:hypothetical protein